MVKRCTKTHAVSMCHLDLDTETMVSESAKTTCTSIRMRCPSIATADVNLSLTPSSTHITFKGNTSLGSSNGIQTKGKTVTCQQSECGFSWELGANNRWSSWVTLDDVVSKVLAVNDLSTSHV